MNEQERLAAWRRCEEIRHEMERLLRDDRGSPRQAPRLEVILLRGELDCLEDELSLDLLETTSDPN